MNNESIEVYVYIALGIAGAPSDVLGVHVTDRSDDTPKPRESWRQQTYWALSALPGDGYPSVLIHIFYEGDIPADRQRDLINRQVQTLTGKLLFGEQP